MADEPKGKLLSFLSPRCVIEKVGEGDTATEVVFYQCSLAMLLKLKNLAKPMAKAITQLFAKPVSDTGQITRKFKNVETNEAGEETILEAISEDMAKYRDEQKDKAISNLVDAITDDKNQNLLLELIMDSARDLFPRPILPQHVQQFKEELNVSALWQFLKGMAKANWGVMEGKEPGNLMRAVREKADAALKLAKEKMTEVG